MVPKKFTSLRDKWNEVGIKSLCFNNIRLHQNTKQEHILAMLMKQWLIAIEYLQNRLNLYLLNVSYSVFDIHYKVRKMLSFYLLQWVQIWQHMLFASISNKWQIKNWPEVYYQPDRFWDMRQGCKKLCLYQKEMSIHGYSNKHQSRFTYYPLRK